MNRTSFVTVLLSVALAGCATTQSLPQSPADVKLDPGRFEQGYWPRYTANTTFRNQSVPVVFEAAKAALVSNRFTIVREELSKGVVMGEHGATLFYWNVMAGIYLTQVDADVEIKVVTVGSKDVGFVELAPSDWPAKILSAIAPLLENRR